MIQNLQGCLQDKPGEVLQSRVLNSAMEGASASHPIKRKIRLKPLLAAAAMSVILAISAFAYGDSIRQFIFGNDNPARDNLVSFGTINNMQISIGAFNIDVNDWEPRGFKVFDTLEEANQFSLFTIKEPDYLPEDTRLLRVEVTQRIDGTSGYWAYLTYEFPGVESKPAFVLRQLFVGANAYFELQEENANMKKIQIGGEDAVAVLQEECWWLLYWIKDGVIYELKSFDYDLDTLIAIAESVR
jgi:hypothetical protein